MTNPTSNFGWQMPTSTDLVTDLPADFEVFGQAVDTSLADLKGGTTGQVLKKNTNADMDFVWSADSAGMTNPMTTTGDTIYSSSGSTPARLAIGSTGQVLTVSGGIPAWATPGGALNYTLANTGGTALTGSNTVTVSGLTNANFIMIQVDYSASTTATPFDATLRLNTDSTAKYSYSGLQSIGNTGAQNRLTTSNLNTATSIPLFTSANNVAFGGAATILITGGNSAGLKTISSMGSAQLAQGGAEAGFFINGAYTGSSAISSISLFFANSTKVNPKTS